MQVSCSSIFLEVSGRRLESPTPHTPPRGRGRVLPSMLVLVTGGQIKVLQATGEKINLAKG